MRLIDADELEGTYKNRLGLVMERYGVESSESGILGGAIKLLKIQPTITPERKRGRWMFQDHNKKNGMITTTVYYCPTCSVCGKTGDYNMSFCPNCGADMRGEDES